MSKLDEKEVGGGKNHSRATLRFIKSGLILKKSAKTDGRFGTESAAITPQH